MAGGTGPQDASEGPARDGAHPAGRATMPHTRAVGPNPRMLDPNTETIDPHTETVDPKTDAVDRRSRERCQRLEAIDTPVEPDVHERVRHSSPGGSRKRQHAKLVRALEGVERFLK